MDAGLPSLSFFATAITRGLDELVAVGFGGRTARSSINTYLPTIVSDAPRYVVQGSDVRYSVLRDAEILAYQWTRNGADLRGEAGAELVLRAVRAGDAGSYGARIVTAAGTREVPPRTLQVVPSGAPDPRDPGFAPALPRVPTHAAPLPDGKVVVAGFFGSGGASAYGLARLNADGSLDPTFATGPGAPTFSAIAALRAGADGRIYVYPPLPSRFVPNPAPARAQRVLPNGQLDTVAADDPDPLLVSPQRYEAGGAIVDRVTAGGWSYTAFQAQSSNGIPFEMSFLSSRPGYVRPPDSPVAAAGFSWGYRSDGALWQVRSVLGLRETQGPFRATLYGPDGIAMRGVHASLPNLGRYTILAVAPDGALYVTIDPESGGTPTFARLRPIAGSPGRLRNLSVRAHVGAAGSEPLIVGFVTEGTGETRALMRAIGPGLLVHGVSDAMPDPMLALTVDGAVSVTNDQWPQSIAPRFASVGAFPLAIGSRDAVAESLIGPGAHTVLASPASGSGPGTVLVELYETFDADAPRRFVNLSARGPVAANRALIAGFSIAGDAPARLLVRGVGPALTAFGVSDALPNPRLTLYRGDVALYENDDWSVANPTLPSSNADTGAFTLPRTSADAAMLVTLAPGNYTAVIDTPTGGAGTALIEVFELP